MNKGDKIEIFGTDSIWDGKNGVIEDVNESLGECTVLVDFIPEENKKVRQDFRIDNVRITQAE